LKPEEIWREGSRILVDYESQRIHITSVGDFDLSRALRCRIFIFNIFSKSDTPFDLIVDISQESRSSREAQRVWKEINAHPKVRFVSLCGVSTFAKLMHTLIIGFRKHPKLRLFTNKEAAMAWNAGLISRLKKWFDASKQELPEHRQEVVILVEGVNYISTYEAPKKMFRVDSELKETAFRVANHQIYWKPYLSGQPRTEVFLLD
jgi:hypothetical protein